MLLFETRVKRFCNGEKRQVIKWRQQFARENIIVHHRGILLNMTRSDVRSFLVPWEAIFAFLDITRALGHLGPKFLGQVKALTY